MSFHRSLKAFVTAGFVCAAAASTTGVSHAVVTFTDIAAGLPGVEGGSVAWGDYDNDGDLDILLTGNSSAVYISKVYRNDAGAFTDIGAGLPGVRLSSVALGDYDNDGDLDILLTGDTGSGLISSVHRLDGAPPNTPPATPGDLSASYVPGELTLSWTASTDAQTPAAGLSYNLRVGTTPGGPETVSPMADAATGYRRVVELGNAQQCTTWTLGLEPGTLCYWSVQAIDGAWAGSPFADEESIQLTGVEGEEECLRTVFFLGPAIPNPFNPITEISYGIPASDGPSRVTMNVYDALGRRVTTLVDADQGPGAYHVVWDGRDHRGAAAASGVYFYRLVWQGKVETRRMVLLK